MTQRRFTFYRICATVAPPTKHITPDGDVEFFTGYVTSIAQYSLEVDCHLTPGDLLRLHKKIPTSVTSNEPSIHFRVVAFSLKMPLRNHLASLATAENTGIIVVAIDAVTTRTLPRLVMMVIAIMNGMPSRTVILEGGTTKRTRRPTKTKNQTIAMPKMAMKW